MRIFTIGLVAIICLHAMAAFSQTPGCTDPQASNFNMQATLNDGSCTYANAPVYQPADWKTLPAAVVEWSGMVYWNGLFWGHNDGGNGAWLYALDTLSGTVQKVVQVNGSTNTDWEDIAQDSTYFYIGDFGNNANGNRTNLRIFRIPKAPLLAAGDTIRLQQEAVDTIRFAYPDQTSFTPTGANNTRFDCEAMFYHNNSLHLITKNWVGNYAVHYKLPAEPGTYTAQRLDSLLTNGLMITAADLGAEDQLLLTGYTRAAGCALFLIYGFASPDACFELGNKRRIPLPSAFQTGQLESVCFINGIRGALGSERFQSPFGNVPQQFSRFSTLAWVIDHYRHNVVAFAQPGMMRYNATLDTFEYFNGSGWLPVGSH